MGKLSRETGKWLRARPGAGGEARKLPLCRLQTWFISIRAFAWRRTQSQCERIRTTRNSDSRSGLQVRLARPLRNSSSSFSSVKSLSHSDSLQTHESQHARPPCPSPTPRVYPNSCPSNRWCHPAISFSVDPFSSCPQSLKASGSFPKSQLFARGGQSIRVSASASVLPVNTQDWSPLGWTGWISLQSKRLSRVFSNTTVQKHQFFSAQLSSQSNSHVHTRPLEKP